MRSPSSILVGVLSFASAMLAAGAASALDDCPPGSRSKSEDGFSWCEPTVCANDAQCGPNMTCRPLGLCMEVGHIADAGAKTTDASSRLVVTQVCAPDRSCPQLQTCSVIGRCISMNEAQRMGVLGTPAASSSTGTALPGGEAAPKKSGCGCDVVGASSSDRRGLFAALGLAGAVAVVSGRRARGRQRGS